MSQDILVGKSAQEWFREMVAETLSHRRIRIQEATEFYLVNLLAGFLESERLFVEEVEGTVDQRTRGPHERADTRAESAQRVDGGIEFNLVGAQFRAVFAVRHHRCRSAIAAARLSGK